MEEKVKVSEMDKLFLDKHIQELAYELIKEYGIKHIQAGAWENTQIAGIEDLESMKINQQNYLIWWNKVVDFLKGFEELEGIEFRKSKE